MPTLDAPIVAVTVFVNRARVTRRGTIALEAGEHLLILDTLPETLEPDSVRASGRGAGITLLGVDVKTEFVAEDPQQAVAELEAQLEELNISLQALADEGTAITAQLETLTSFTRNTSRRLANTFDVGTSLESVTSLNTYLGAQMRALHDARRVNVKQQSDLRKQIAAVQAQLNKIRTPKQHQKRLIHVSVRADAATEFELEATYAVTGAAWSPLYDVRLRDNNEVELTYLANVWQRTGEAWDGVDLSLSTARPAISSTLPELHPWYLTVVEPPVMRFQAQAPATRSMGRAKRRQAPADEDFDSFDDGEVLEDGLFASTEVDLLMKPAPIVQAQSTIESGSGGASVTYRVGTPVSVPSDGSPHKTTVAITTLTAKLDYVTAPKIATEAYLRATITNTSAYTLLPGEASIYHADEFVGKTSIGLIAPNDDFKVQLGIDNRIKIERELINREVSKRFIGSARRVSFVYRITVTNLLPTSARINVLDQYPVPRQETIKVSQDSAQPAPTEKTDLGVLTWTFDLAPNAKQIISLSFTVEHNRDVRIAGLPD